MRYWLGAAFTALALLLAYQAWAHRRAVLAENSAYDSDADSGLHPSLELLRHIVPPIVLSMLAIIAAMTTFTFMTVDAQRLLSLFDLFAFLALLVAYGFWITAKSRYRHPKMGSEADRNR